MTWADLEHEQGERTEQDTEQQRDNAQAFDHEVNASSARAIQPDQQHALKRYLFQIATSRSYRVGRSPEDVAWAEGYRALALELLSRGGVTHE